MRGRLLIAVAAISVLLLPVTPAEAAPAAPAQSGNVTIAAPHLMDVKSDCETFPAAASDPGYFPDRYAHCRRGTGVHDVFVNNQKVGEIHVGLLMIGFGNNGAREFNYITYITSITKVGAPTLNLEAVEIGLWFACNVSMLPCTDPASGQRTDTVAGWRAIDFFSTTLISPDVAGAGDQIVRERLSLVIHLTTPGQPFLSGPPNEAMYSNVRYDSASYVGRARGAVFMDYRLVFEVSLSALDQDESALHIFHAQRFPELTFPSWVGKSVPGDDDEPLTRMYNESEKNANRRKSEALCAQLYGSWDSTQVNCDEYPFASTYEGSKTGPERNGGYDRFSVRLIDRDDNQYVGSQMLEVQFFRVNRVLDGDKFAVHVIR